MPDKPSFGDGRDPDADALASLLAPFSVVPEDHSLAKGTAPDAVKKTFEGWTSVFSNQDPICVAWFPEGVPSATMLNSRTEGGVMDLRFRGARNWTEARMLVAEAQAVGGCGFVVTRRGDRPPYGLCERPCTSFLAFGRCVHYFVTSGWTERDAERGMQFFRDRLLSDPRSPQERWDMTGDRPRRLGTA